MALKGDRTPPLAPTVTLASPINLANQSAVTIAGTGEDVTTARISIDDIDSTTAALTTTAPVVAGGYSLTIDASSLSDGTVTATVTLSDAAGNSSQPGTATAIKDTVAPLPPSVAIAPDPVNPANQTAVAIAGGGEVGTTARISVDDTDPRTAPVTAAATTTSTGYIGTVDLTTLAGGTLTATVTLTDAVGNEGLAGTTTARKAGPPPRP